MFVHNTKLRHLLRPIHYHDPQHYQAEIQHLFRPSWQFACTRQELKNDGDFITLDLFGTPLLIRNSEGAIRAFENICPHRHAMLTCESSGNCETIRCQYHGWEFNDEGRTGRIPEAKAFRPWDRENSQLNTVRAEFCGDLLFVTRADEDETPPLAQWMAPLYDDVATAFSEPMWRMAETWEFDSPCNWKIPTENTLESYHVAQVHPKWLGGELPAERCTEHRLNPRYTTLDYQADLPMEEKQAKVNRYLGGDPTFLYRHWHIHPNIAFCMTDTFSYLASCLPTSPTTCRIRTRMFPLQGTRKNPWASLVRHVAWRMGRRIMYGVFNEDRSIFDAQQRGLNASDQTGVIGSREERIYVFQDYIRTQLQLDIPPDPAAIKIVPDEPDVDKPLSLPPR